MPNDDFRKQLDDITRPLSKVIDDKISDSLSRINAALTPRIPDTIHLTPPPVPISPAESTYKRLGDYIKDFEATLDDEHEIGGRLVSFGHTVVFHIEDIGYYGPDIITFYGINENGERVQLIQNISQLSVLLVAVKKIGDKPRRIGFLWDDK